MPLVQKKSLFRLVALLLSRSLRQLFPNCRDAYLLCPSIQLSTSTHMYVLCWLPTLSPSARLAPCPPGRWSVPLAKAELSGGDGLWWAARSPPFCRDQSLPVPLTFAWHTTGAQPLAHTPKQRRFQRGKKRGELTGTSDCDPAPLCGGDYGRQCCCG